MEPFTRRERNERFNGYGVKHPPTLTEHLNRHARRAMAAKGEVPATPLPEQSNPPQQAPKGRNGWGVPLIMFYMLLTLAAWGMVALFVLGVFKHG